MSNKQLPAFVTSTKPASMTIKTQNKSLVETRKQTSKLEQESKNMEDRLKDLKMLLSRDKMERNSSGSVSTTGSNIWGSSNLNPSSTKPSVSTSRSNATLIGASSGSGSAPVLKPKLSHKENIVPKKVKVLKDIPIEEPPKVPSQIMAYAKMMDYNTSSSNSSQKNSEGIPLCGTCLRKHVTVTCLECQDHFCSMCFAKAHLKGEAKKHKSTAFDDSKIVSTRSSIQAQGDVANYFTRDGIKFHNVEQKSATPKSTFSVDSKTTKQSDVFNEEESAASFQEALREWRTGGKTVVATKPATPMKPKECRAVAVGDSHVTSMQTTDDIIADIKFRDDSSLNYAEKLLLKQAYQRNSARGGRLLSGLSMNSSLGYQEENEGSYDLERSELRENISRYFSPREPKNSKILTEIEITEVSDDKLETSGVNETTLCSVEEPDFGSQMTNFPLSQKQNTITEFKIIETANADLHLNGKTTNADKNVRQNQQGTKNEDSTVNKSTPRKPLVKPKTPKTKTSSKTPRASATGSRASNKNPLNSSRPTSAMSLSREPTMQLSEIAKLPKSGTAIPNFELENILSNDNEEKTPRNEAHFIRKDSQEIDSYKLITVKKSKAPWRPNSSLLSDVQLESVPEPKNPNEYQGMEEGFSEFENEILLLEKMGRQSTSNQKTIDRKSTSGKTKKSEVTSIPLGDISDSEDVDQQTLDDLEYELACNTGRLTADGQRVDRITEDLEGIMKDLDVASNESSKPKKAQSSQDAEDQFTLSFNVEMQQDYLSDDEDYPLSVRNL